MKKGYKVFKADFSCSGNNNGVAYFHQFSENSEHKLDVAPKLCKKGFHYCPKPNDCFDYYPFDSENIVCEVEAVGDIVTGENENKCCTNHIRIGRRLTWHEVLTLINQGKNNTGRANSGDRNSGNLNSGDRNSGNLNSGNLNSGNLNSGDRNSGNRNSGNLNSGDWNSGDWNSGNRNSGNLNSGNLNSGDRNSGDWNSGDWNSGVLCTKNAEILLFDKPSGMTLSQWRDTEAYYLMRDIVLAEWVSWSRMSDAEKDAFPRAETQEGYLKRYEYKQAHATWWANLDARQRTVFTGLKHFDKSQFQHITGIDVDNK